MYTRACQVVPVLSQVNSAHFHHAVSQRYIVVLSYHWHLLPFLVLEQKFSMHFFYYETVALSVVCGCYTSVIMREEESRLRVCENSVLRGIFRPKRTAVTR